MLAVKILLGILLAGVACSQNDPVTLFTLTVLHTNDIHSHIEPSSKYGGVCSNESKAKNDCYGGVARIVTKVKELKQRYPSALFMNGGDFYQGTPWYTLLKHHLVSLVMENMFYDYLCLGNHEFDDGPEGLAPFLLRMIAANITVVNTNANFSLSEDLKEIKLPKSVKVNVSGRTIGIVGAVLHQTKELSNPGPVFFENDLDSLRTEANKLKEEGITIVVAITHCGYLRDLEIVRQVEAIDIVVGGHSNTFLYNGTPPQDTPEGNYPTVVNRSDGTQGLVVQDFWFGKYLGFLQVTFDAAGNVVSYGGNPILLNSSVQEDADMLKLIEPLKQNVSKQISQIIGKTCVLLEQADNVCRVRECNLGNLMADAYYDYYACVIEHTDETNSDVMAAVVNGGSMRAPIEVGDIIMGSILTTSPFGQTIVVVTLTGLQLRNMFEHSVSRFNYVNRKGEFLQVSRHIRVEYNISRPAQQRVKSLRILERGSVGGEHKEVQNDKIYKIATTDYVANGGDGFTKLTNVTEAGPLDFDVLTKYINKTSPIIIGLEGRITLLGNVTVATTTATAKSTAEATTRANTGADSDGSIPAETIVKPM